MSSSYSQVTNDLEMLQAQAYQETQQQRYQQFEEQQFEQQQHPFYSLLYWQRYFMVETTHVLERMLASILPTKSFVELVQDNPDFYGPFWIPTTVIFVMFAASSGVESVTARWKGQTYAYDLSRLVTAASTIYTYLFAVPLVVFAIGRYYNSTIKLFDLINVFGYGLTIWIPVAVCFFII